jgi:peptide deformylase
MEHIIQTGLNNSILRTHSLVIKDFSNELRKLEKKMIKIMKKNKGVGLAAPQIGKNIRMCICTIDQKKLITLCNPEIIKSSKETITDEEGCLSLPGIWGDVIRPKEIQIKYQDVNGKEKNLKFSDLNARIILHELDHLNGILFLDKTTGEIRMEADVSPNILGDMKNNLLMMK